MKRPLVVPVIALAIVAALAVAAVAQAQPPAPGTTVRPAGVLVEPDRYDVPPAGRRLSAREVLERANRLEKVGRVRAEHPDAYERVYLIGVSAWQFSLFTPPVGGDPDREEVVQVLVDDGTGRVTEAWTGVQVEWPMARGYPGAFGRAVNSPWIWIGLCILFVLPFVRSPLRLLHLDLAVLLGFSISYAFFGAANLDVSVPSAYPLLGYLLVRMLLVARRRERTPAPLRVGPGFLLIAIAFLVGFRVVLNLVDGNVIDVGYSGVIGADRLAAGEPVYGAFPLDNPRGDTYGPVAYAAYVPFEAIWPSSGTWDDLPAAHAAALAFDLGSALLLYFLGRRLHGHDLGLLLSYLWVTYPFTLLVANSGANDAVVSLLVLAALLVAARPVARGALVAVAGLTKFAPLALAPLFATHRSRRSWLGSVAWTLLAFAVVLALVLAPVDVSVFWRRTLGFQQDRASPFSLWGYYGLPGALQSAGQVVAVLFAAVVAFVPRRRDAGALAALAAAVLIAVQITVDHWFYLYIVWFAPLVWVALLTPTPGAGSVRSNPLVPVASNGSAPR